MMRALIVLGIVAALTLAAVSTAPGSVGTAKVRLVDPSPVTLKGVGFAANEPLRLTVSLGERALVRKLLVPSNGTFLVRFPTATYNRCNGELSVRAEGARGSRAAWTLVPLDCPVTVTAAPAH
jgi:hypothetical protein